MRENASLRYVRQIVRLRRAATLTLILSKAPVIDAAALAAMAVAARTASTGSTASSSWDSISSGEWSVGEGPTAGAGTASDGEMSFLDAVGELVCI